ITPRAEKRMFHNGQELDVSKAQLLDVHREFVCELAVGQRAIPLGGLTSPRAQVHFVDRNGAVEGVALRSLLHPLLICPVVLRIPDDRGSPGSHLVVEPEWIRLVHSVVTSARNDVVLIPVSLRSLRDEALPDAGGGTGPESIALRFPVV